MTALSTPDYASAFAVTYDDLNRYRRAINRVSDLIEDALEAEMFGDHDVAVERMEQALAAITHNREITIDQMGIVA